MYKSFLTINIYFILFFAFLSPIELHAQDFKKENKGCILIMAGKDATKHNSILLGHNNDLSGDEISFIKKFPRQKHDTSEYITFDNGLKIPRNNISSEWMVLQTNKGFKEGDAVAINEHYVAIAGGVSLIKDRNKNAEKYDPLVDTGVTGGIRYIALQRAGSARECVKLIGKFYNKYGIKYPSGIGIADKDEVWYMEAGGGSHWAAIKIPDDACWVQANEYRIDYIDPESDDVITSPGLLEFAKKYDLWDPDEELLSFKKVFGGAVHKNSKNPNYNTRRIWRTIDLLAPSLQVEPDQESFPTFIRPEKKIDLKDIISILKDHYQDTKFNPYATNNDSINERPIASPKTVHSSVIQLRSGFPVNVGAILWTGLSSPLVTPYVPIYFGINEVPKLYSDKIPDSEKAFSYFKRLADIYYSNPQYFSSEYPGLFEDFQEKCFKEKNLIDHNAFHLYRSSRRMALHMITVGVESFCHEAIELAKKYHDELVSTRDEEKEKTQ